MLGIINFFYETGFVLEPEAKYKNWLIELAASQKRSVGEINYIFCDDEYLLNINREYLNHDYYTDIISFESGVGNVLHGDIFISVERVKENSAEFEVRFEEELVRVMAHGILHFCGYKDKTQEEERIMRQKEEEAMKMFHVEQ